MRQLINRVTADKLTEIERLENEFLEVANKVAKMNAAEAEQQKTTTEKGSGVKYSIAENFSTEFDKAISGDEYYKNNAVAVGKMLNVYVRHGFDINKNVTITPKHLKDIIHTKEKGNSKYHGLTKEKVIEAISQLESPALLIKSPTNSDVIVAFTTALDFDGIPISVYISKNGKAYINSVEESTHHILSMYGRNNTANFINSAINDNRVIDGNKIKAEELQNILGLSLSLPDNILSIDSTDSIPNSPESVNKKFSLPKNPTPEQIGQALYDHEISMEA